MLDYRHVIRRPRDMSEVEVRIELDEDGLPRLVCCWVAWSLVGGQVALWREDAAEWQDIAESLAARLKELAPEVAAEIIDDDEPEARAFERASRIEPNAGTEFTVHRSRYHRSKLAVCVPTVDGFPARAALVLDEMGVRYSHRERAYLATDSQVRALVPERLL